MNPLTGKRKFFGFLFSLLLFTFVVIISLYRVPPEQIELPSFVFQLAASYSVICGLFFGSNVLEHYSPSGDRGRNEN